MAKSRHPIIEGLFSLDGRMRRSEYWLISIGLGIIKAVLVFLTKTIGEGGGAVAEGLVELVFLWPSLALMVKRGHDRNRSMLYTLGVLAMIFVVAIVGGMLGMFFSFETVRYALPLLIGVVFVYIFIDYGCLDGTKGRNRYGLSPKGVRGPEDDEIDKVFA